MIRKHTLFITIFLLSFNAKAQEGKLERQFLFSIPSEKFKSAAGFNFKIAVDAKENVAINACSKPFVYIYNTSGEQIDSVSLPFGTCIRNMEYDVSDNLLIMDNDELNIYRYVSKYHKLETHPYAKPEDWFNLLNHYYKNFELATLPTYYSNNDYLQDFYTTRFSYSYNLFLNYKDGYIYQCHYNFIKKINNHKLYTSQKKNNIWLSDNISIRTKILLIDADKHAAVYYDRFYNLIYENFDSGLVTVNAALAPNSEAARFDYAVNSKQNKIFGISSFNRMMVEISSWELK